jgi:hypothetical protein
MLSCTGFNLTGYFPLVFIAKCAQYNATYNTNTNLHSFSFHIAKSWNQLSTSTRDAKDINAFKNLLDDNAMFEYDN